MIASFRNTGVHFGRLLADTASRGATTILDLFHATTTSSNSPIAAPSESKSSAPKTTYKSSEFNFLLLSEVAVGSYLATCVTSAMLKIYISRAIPSGNARIILSSIGGVASGLFTAQIALSIMDYIIPIPYAPAGVIIYHLSHAMLGGVVGYALSSEPPITACNHSHRVIISLCTHHSHQQHRN